IAFLFAASFTVPAIFPLPAYATKANNRRTVTAEETNLNEKLFIGVLLVITSRGLNNDES
ncbi:MAG: hypothetical protein AABZ61_14635, partial [Bacteroidota bacterium]